ncbi:MAG: 4-carboxymuconolactone decarboxylase [Paracoccaceae bacterium]
MTNRYDQGTKTRRAVLGDAHVNRSTADPDAWEAPFFDMITESAWAHVWSREAIPLRERSMITLALLAGLGNIDEFKLHLRATANTGASKADVLEVLLHVAIYAGVPRANHAIKIAKEIYAEMEAAHD